MRGRGRGRGAPIAGVEQETEEQTLPLLSRILDNIPTTPTPLTVKVKWTRQLRMQHFLVMPTYPISLLWKPSEYSAELGRLATDLRADVYNAYPDPNTRAQSLSDLADAISNAPIAKTHIKDCKPNELQYKVNHLWSYRTSTQWHAVLYLLPDSQTFVLVRIFKDDQFAEYRRFLDCWECGFAKTDEGKRFYKCKQEQGTGVVGQ